MRRHAHVMAAVQAEVDRLYAFIPAPRALRVADQARMPQPDFRVEPLERRQLLAGNGLAATYYDNPDFSGPSIERVDPAVDFNWDVGAPADGIDADTFSAIWVGQVTAPRTETFRFRVEAGEFDGVRLWVGGKLLVDNWAGGDSASASGGSGEIALTAGKKYDLRIEYREGNGPAAVRLLWSSPSALAEEVVPGRAFSLAPPKPVEIFRVAVASDTELNLKWRDSSKDEDGYIVEQSKNGGPFQKIALLGANVTAYLARNLDPSTTYDFRVTPFSHLGGAAPGAAAKRGRTKAHVAATSDAVEGDYTVAALAALPFGGRPPSPRQPSRPHR